MAEGVVVDDDPAKEKAVVGAGAGLAVAAGVVVDCPKTPVVLGAFAVVDVDGAGAAVVVPNPPVGAGAGLLLLLLLPKTKDMIDCSRSYSNQSIHVQTINLRQDPHGSWLLRCARRC